MVRQLRCAYGVWALERVLLRLEPCSKLGLDARGEDLRPNLIERGLAMCVRRLSWYVGSDQVDCWLFDHAVGGLFDQIRHLCLRSATVVCII